MVYYGKNRTMVIDYASEEYQLCWTCKNACGGCSWSQDGTPVEGWTAEKSFLPSNGKYADTYKIIKCPLYNCDRRYGVHK